MQYPATISTLLLAVSLLSACDSSVDDPSRTTPGTVYSLANGCFSIGVPGTSQFVAASASNTEGMVHLGLVAELIEDVRRDGVTDEELEPFFKSAEGYIRMWEKAERRGRDLSAGAP